MVLYDTIDKFTDKLWPIYLFYFKNIIILKIIIKTPRHSFLRLGKNKNFDL